MTARPNADALFADPRAWLNAYHVPDRVRARQRAILNAIDHTPRTARQIASVVGCSPRTVYRDVECLRGMGAPIGGAAGLGYVRTAGPRRAASHIMEART